MPSPLVGSSVGSGMSPAFAWPDELSIGSGSIVRFLTVYSNHDRDSGNGASGWAAIRRHAKGNYACRMRATESYASKMTTTPQLDRQELVDPSMSGDPRGIHRTMLGRGGRAETREVRHPGIKSKAPRTRFTNELALGTSRATPARHTAARESTDMREDRRCLSKARSADITGNPCRSA